MNEQAAMPTWPTQEDFSRVITEAIERRIKIYPRNSLWASQMDHPCIRNLEYGLTRWQDQLKHSVELQQIFDEGNVHEPAVIDKLKKCGFKERQSQRPLFEKVSKDGKEYRYGISGRLDLEITHDELLGGEWFPAEIKSMEPHAWESINSVSDMLNHKRYYLRMYPGQIMMYLYAMGKYNGLMILKNKINGRLKFIWIELQMDVVERMLQKAEEVNRVVKEIQDNPQRSADDFLTERIEYDDRICGSCPFRHICLPNQQFDGQTIELDKALEDDLERREILKMYWNEYEELHEMLREKFKAKGDGKYLTAGYNITVKTGTVTRKATAEITMSQTRVDIKKVK